MLLKLEVKEIRSDSLGIKELEERAGLPQEHVELPVECAGLPKECAELPGECAELGMNEPGKHVEQGMKEQEVCDGLPGVRVGLLLGMLRRMSSSGLTGLLCGSHSAVHHYAVTDLVSTM